MQIRKETAPRAAQNRCQTRWFSGETTERVSEAVFKGFSFYPRAHNRRARERQGPAEAALTSRLRSNSAAFGSVRAARYWAAARSSDFMQAETSMAPASPATCAAHLSSTPSENRIWRPRRHFDAGTHSGVALAAPAGSHPRPSEPRCLLGARAE